ncbi:MAG TPA: efflux RND transporter periplasmic adaptor subunit [Candidatus Sulfopaludibacter sp.]|jgi:RND family efflux transporter MFP subunit|nr:efflux RND transporter periplasmic adaptor subunit [Candidatus Sulfopaludibacter sp.]
MNQTNSTEDQLRSEIDQLKRQLAEQKNRQEEREAGKAPTYRSLVFVVVLLAALAIAGYYLGYLPRQKREQVLAAESQTNGDSVPMVNVVAVSRSAKVASLMLPGNIQAVTEAPILARASGYIRKRYVDIGDRVQANQVVAEIEAPELEQQIRQAKAAVDQANAAVQQTQAALQQGQSNETLARVTAERWKKLLDRGVVSRQDNDTYQLQWAAQQANVQALEKAIIAAKSNAGAAEANVARLTQLKDYQTVRAPFAGVITVRNIDTGALVNEGSTLLYRVAQTDRLRTYLNVPQVDASSVRVGQTATLTIPDLPGRTFPATVTRTSNALDPTSRTLLVEVQLSNGGGQLVPGMYAQVDLSVPRKDPPLVIPGDTLVIRADGPQVAVVQPDGAVHFARIQLGRDFGSTLEVLGGLSEGQELAVNPSDAIREGAKVKAVRAEDKPAAKKG